MKPSNRKIGLLRNQDAVNEALDVINEEHHPLENTNLDPLEWVKKYLKSKGINYHYKTNSFFLNGNILEDPILISELRLGLYKHGQTHLKSYVPDALKMIKRVEKKESLDNLKSTLAYDRHSSVNIDQVLRSIGELSDLDCMVFKHWLWLVKRKLFNLPTEHELMLVIYGKSGAGKSYLLRKLLEPLLMVTSFTDMRVFNDQFGLRQFTRNRVMVFDELDMVSEVSVEKLKNVITAQEISWRVLRSEAVMSGRQNCSFVATTNLPVNEQIKDSTSARRYWQIETRSKLNWNFVNSFDFKSLWISIDESGSCPIADCLEEVHKIQNEVILYKDNIDTWIELFIEKATQDNDLPRSTDLYNHFLNYCELNGINNSYSRHKFCRQLHHKLKINGFDGEIKFHRHNGTAWNIKIKDKM